MNILIIFAYIINAVGLAVYIGAKIPYGIAYIDKDYRTMNRLRIVNDASVCLMLIGGFAVVLFRYIPELLTLLQAGQI